MTDATTDADADERAGIVAALTEATAETFLRLGWTATHQHVAEALAPTVARLMAQAAEEAVAERLAGVEALARAWEAESRRTGPRLARLMTARVAAEDLRAALHPKGTDR